MSDVSSPTGARAHHARDQRYWLALGSLVIMAMLWGSTFFSLKDLTLRIPVADMLAVRFTIAAVAIGVLAWKHWQMNRQTFVQGLTLGFIFGIAQLLQTWGLAQTLASVSGFVTGLYVVFTPILAALILRDKIPGLTWLAVGLATAGLAILALRFDGGALVGFGVWLTLISALLYGAHIVALGHFSTPSNALSLTLVQTVVVALLCWVAAVPGGITLPKGAADWATLLYLALIAGALTLFLQIWAQARVAPTPAAVIMSGEPVWAAVFAVLLGGEIVTWRMLLGGTAIMAALFLVILVPAWLERRRERMTP